MFYNLEKKMSITQGSSWEGVGTPVSPPLRHAHPRPPLEPEADSILLNLHKYIQIFYLSYQSTMSQFVHFIIFLKFFFVL